MNHELHKHMYPYVGILSYQRLKVTDIGRYGKKILWIFGFYYGHNFKKHRFHRLMSILTICIFLGHATLITVNPIINGNIALFLDASLYMVGLSRLCIKLAVCSINLPKLHHLENLLDQERIFNMQTVEQDQFIAAAKATYQKIIKISFVLLFSIVIIFILCPLVTKYNFFTAVWIPNSTVEQREAVGYIYGSVGGIIATCIFPSLECLFVEYTFIMRTQFQILKDNIKHATVRDVDEEFAIQERTIQERLITCVIHQNAILDVVTKCNELFSIVTFCQILLTTLELCLCFLQFAVGSTTSNIPEMVIYSSSILFQIFVICWLGQEIKSESSGIIEACYMTEWYTCSTSTRKMLFIIMENSKQPVVLKAGYFFELSFDTFITILRTGYSYYAVLSQFY